MNLVLVVVGESISNVVADKIMICSIKQVSKSYIRFGHLFFYFEKQKRMEKHSCYNYLKRVEIHLTIMLYLCNKELI